MVLSAMLTIEPSTVDMNVPLPTAANAHHLRA
jgi:hypothetical protein